jgi:hypothetical protein
MGPTMHLKYYRIKALFRYTLSVIWNIPFMQNGPCQFSRKHLLLQWMGNCYLQTYSSPLSCHQHAERTFVTCDAVSSLLMECSLKSNTHSIASTVHDNYIWNPPTNSEFLYIQVAHFCCRTSFGYGPWEKAIHSVSLEGENRKVNHSE